MATPQSLPGFFLSDIASAVAKGRAVDVDEARVEQEGIKSIGDFGRSLLQVSEAKKQREHEVGLEDKRIEGQKDIEGMRQEGANERAFGEAKMRYEVGLREAYNAQDVKQQEALAQSKFDIYVKELQQIYGPEEAIKIVKQTYRQPMEKIEAEIAATKAQTERTKTEIDRILLFQPDELKALQNANTGAEVAIARERQAFELDKLMVPIKLDVAMSEQATAQARIAGAVNQNLLTALQAQTLQRNLDQMKDVFNLSVAKFGAEQKQAVNELLGRTAALAMSESGRALSAAVDHYQAVQRTLADAVPGSAEQKAAQTALEKAGTAIGAAVERHSKNLEILNSTISDLANKLKRVMDSGGMTVPGDIATSFANEFRGGK
jgi:hypothetical protein